jgi:hypothetical protein
LGKVITKVNILNITRSSILCPIRQIESKVHRIILSFMRGDRQDNLHFEEMVQTFLEGKFPLNDGHKRQYHYFVTLLLVLKVKRVDS